MRSLTRIALAILIALGPLAAFWYFGARPAGHREASETDEAFDKFHTMPSKYWFEQRAFPNETIPVEAYEEARQKALIDHTRAQLSTSALSWEFIGPTNIGGRITAMVAGTGGTPIWIASANG